MGCSCGCGAPHGCVGQIDQARERLNAHPHWSGDCRDGPWGISPELGSPHISDHQPRGYVEYDPFVRLPDGEKLHGDHGLMDLRAEIGRTAFDAGLLETPIIQSILKDK